MNKNFRELHWMTLDTANFLWNFDQYRIIARLWNGSRLSIFTVLTLLREDLRAEQRDFRSQTDARVSILMQFHVHVKLMRTTNSSHVLWRHWANNRLENVCNGSFTIRFSWSSRIFDYDTRQHLGNDDKTAKIRQKWSTRLNVLTYTCQWILEKSLGRTRLYESNSFFPLWTCIHHHEFHFSIDRDMNSSEFFILRWRNREECFRRSILLHHRSSNDNQVTVLATILTHNYWRRIKSDSQICIEYRPSVQTVDLWMEYFKSCTLILNMQTRLTSHHFRLSSRFLSDEVILLEWAQLPRSTNATDFCDLNEHQMTDEIR